MTNWEKDRDKLDWKDTEKEIGVLDHRVFNGNIYTEQTIAWLKVLPQIGRVLGFKLQQYDYVWSPSDHRGKNERRTNYRVIRKDLLNRVKDKEYKND